MVLWQPRKRVGASPVFKGVRGPYLIQLMVYTLSIGALCFIVAVLGLPFLITISFIISLLFLLIIQFKKLKKKSKGDIHSEKKSKCTRQFSIKSSPISYDLIKKN